MNGFVKIFGTTQAVITVLGFLVLNEGRDLNTAASFAIGGLIVLFNVVSWAFLISQLIQKKLIALSLTLIVFKYAILGLIIFKLLSLAWIDKIWFSAGLGSIIVSALLYSAFTKTDDEEEKFNN